MKPEEESAAANASNGDGRQQQPQAAVPPKMNSVSNNNNGNVELQQNSIIENNEVSSQQKKPPDSVAPATTAAAVPAASTFQLPITLNRSSGGGVQAVPAPLFFPPSQPSATSATGMAHISSVGSSLPFLHGNAGVGAVGMLPTLGTMMNHPFVPLPQALAAASGEQQQRLLCVTPFAFRNTKLRAGKWLREEEAYAELLIDLFEKGHLVPNDCQNGTTLRAYLSQKLHCAPMRISKKYAGRGIGKMVYLCKQRAGSSSSSATPSLVDRQQQQQQKQLEIVLQTTEAKFIKAALPTNDFLALRSPTMFVDLFSGGPIHAHAAAAAPPLLQHHGLASLVAQQQLQQPPPLLGHTIVPTFSQLPLFANAGGQLGANTTLAQQQAQAAFAVAFASAAAAAAAGAVDPSSVLAQQQQALAAAGAAAPTRVIPVGAQTQSHPAPAVATTAGATTTVAPLHHGQVAGQAHSAQATVSPTFNGLAAAGTTVAQQQQIHPALVVGQQLAQQTEQLQMNPSLSSHHTQHHYQHHPQAALLSTHNAQGNTTVLHAAATIDPGMQLQQAFLNSLMQASMSFPNQLQVPHAAAVSSQNMHEATATQSVAPSGSQAHSMLQSTSHHAKSIPQQACHVNEMPDFLSGFDNVALNSTTPNVATAPLLHGSPPLTSSRSFDEFHRFLGDDLALLEQTTKEAATGVPPQEGSSKSATRVPASQQGSQPPCAVPDTMALFSADSYAMFAQESAMAASQHAAYLNDSVGNLTDGMKTTRKSPMFDIENVVKLVSEHVPAQTNRLVTTPSAVDGNRAKNSPVNALDQLAEVYSNQQQQQQQHHSRQQHHHRPHNPFLLRLASNQGSAMTMTEGLSAQSGQLLNLPNGSSNAPQVSGSELASSTETESSQPGSASESNASDSNNGSDSNNTGNDDSEDGNPDSLDSSNDSDASGSYSDEGPCPKKTKHCQWQTRPRNGAHVTNNEEA